MPTKTKRGNPLKSWRSRGDVNNLTGWILNTAHCLKNAIDKKDWKEAQLCSDELIEEHAKLRIILIKEKLL